LAPVPLLSLLAAFSAAPAAAPRDDATAALAAMKQAAAARRSLHAVVQVEVHRADRAPATRFVECWIDVRRGLVRTELRDRGMACPKLAAVAGPSGARFHQLEVDELAAQSGPLDLGSALAATLAGELLATAFRGDLLTFKAAAYGRPRAAEAAETAGGVRCTRLVFGGNAQADLWIGESDCLPRRIRGPVPGATIDETIVRLDLDPDLARIDFAMAVPDGTRLPDPSEVRERWSSPPPEPDRWPRPEDDAPDFSALDLEGTAHLLSETGEHPAILAFWTAEDERSPALAAKAEQAWRAARAVRPAALFLHVAAGDERGPVARAAAAHRLEQPVWVTGSHPGDAFRAWRIWTCPVFARIDDMQVIAVTSDLDEVRRWLE